MDGARKYFDLIYDLGLNANKFSFSSMLKIIMDPTRNVSHEILIAEVIGLAKLMKDKGVEKVSIFLGIYYFLGKTQKNLLSDTLTYAAEKH